MATTGQLSGEIARAVFELDIAYEPQDEPPRVLARGKGRDTAHLSGDDAVAHLLRTKVLDELREAADAHFSAIVDDGDVQTEVVVKAGSVEILVVVSAVGSVIGSYNALVGGIAQAVENTRRAYMAIVQGLRELGAWDGRMEMRSSWRPGTALATSRRPATAALPSPTASAVSTPERTGGRWATLATALSAVQALLLLVLVVLVWVRT